MENNQDHQAAFAFLGTVRRKDITVLQSAVLLQALHGAYHAHRVAQQLAASLRVVCTEDWIRTAPLATVFAVANALHFYDEKLVSGRHVGVLAQRLIASEKAPGGPYAEPGEDPDSFTNSLIAVFAGWAAGTLPGTNVFLQQQVTNGLQSSIVPPFILERYIAMIDGFHVTETAVPETIDNTYTAAATLWGQPIVEHDVEPSEENRTQAILEHIATETAKLDTPLAEQSTAMLERIARANKQHEITLLPWYFQSGLIEQINHDTNRLGIANVYCWMAYMLYDRMLDDNKGIELLPLANIAQRKALYYYRLYAPSAESLVEMTFTRMDQANAWENEHAKTQILDGSVQIAELPEYGNGHQLATRSYAHVLGPLLIAIEQGHQLRSTELQLLRSAFWHYLIARQLNDDAHDWQEDLNNGQLTFVVTKLLRAKGITQGNYSLAALIPELQQLFRTSVSQEIAEIMTIHCAKAKELFRQSTLLANETMLDQLCDTIEASAQHMVSASKESEELLSAF